jgi:hypothetical protein
MHAQPTGFIFVELGDELQFPRVGSLVAEYIVAAGNTLLIGDAVFSVGQNTVGKSLTATDYVRFVGFVVGGDATQMLCNVDKANVGKTAALAGQRVLVATLGRAWAINGAAFTAGTTGPVVPSAAVAGRVIAGTTAGQQLATNTQTEAVTAAGVIVQIAHR